MKLTWKQNIESLEKNFTEACQDENFVKLVKELKLTKKEALLITSKLIDTTNELKNCENCQGLNKCKNHFQGHVSIPKKTNKVYFTYVPCKYLKQKIKEQQTNEKMANINQDARMKDIDITDKKRLKVIKWLDNFYQNYHLNTKNKGLYLHGNFGCGKTFLISALFNELKSEKQISAEIIYFPELLRTLKNDWEFYEEKIRTYEKVDLLCIDDIGAEKVSEWSRDEVLGTILQTRMNQNKATFFTSNLTLDELEKHFQTNASLEETLKSRRIMERITQLSTPLELISENRRN